MTWIRALNLGILIEIKCSGTILRFLSFKIARPVEAPVRPGTYSEGVVATLASLRADVNASAHLVIIRLATALLFTLVRHSA